MYKEQSERKSSEINKKNLELVEKIGQLDQLKLQYQENASKIYILETKVKREKFPLHSLICLPYP